MSLFRCATHGARRFKSTANFVPPILTTRQGMALVHDPLTNKGTGFPLAERDRLGIRGLVPPRQLPLDVQAEKIMAQVRQRPTDVEKHIFLASLQDRNETLFYRVLIDHIEELAPYVYTPTVGQVCQEFGSNFRKTRGMYVSSQDRGSISAMMHNWPHDDVDVIVVTDGSRILGLGDLGANGMGISIGKLALYVAAGGIQPNRVLPVMLDCGTDNEALLADPYYLGVQHSRLRKDAYFSLVDEFVQASFDRFPNALMQFEDFNSHVASNLLNRYRFQHLCFNDDIQGTGSTALAGVLCAVRTQGEEAKLGEQRIVVLGSGSAGLGVASTLLRGMEIEGTSREDALKQFYVLDDKGLLGEGRDPDSLTGGQRMFSRSDLKANMSLLEVVKEVKPTVLLGLTGVPGLFTEDVIREMSKHVERPIVFPLSNPTSRAECTAEQAYHWSGGRAVVASGSPFTPVEVDGRMMFPSQCNNMFIFPGVGVGATLVGAKRVTDQMFYDSAVALSRCVSHEELERGMVFPSVSRIRDVSHAVACAVVKSALADGIARVMPSSADVESFVADNMYTPTYRPIVQRLRRV